MWHLVEREWSLIASAVSALVTPQIIVPGLLIQDHQLLNLQTEAHGMALPPIILIMANGDAESVWCGTISSIPVVLFPIVHLNTPVHIASTILVSWIKVTKPDSVHIKCKITQIVDQSAEGLTSLICISLAIIANYIVIQI